MLWRPPSRSVPWGSALLLLVSVAVLVSVFLVVPRQARGKRFILQTWERLVNPPPNGPQSPPSSRQILSNPAGLQRVLRQMRSLQAGLRPVVHGEGVYLDDRFDPPRIETWRLSGEHTDLDRMEPDAEFMYLIEFEDITPTPLWATMIHRSRMDIRVNYNNPHGQSPLDNAALRATLADIATHLTDAERRAVRDRRRDLSVIVWPEVAINAATLAAVPLAVWSFVRKVRWGWRRIRLPKGMCFRCGYGLHDGLCTECGSRTG